MGKIHRDEGVNWIVDEMINTFWKANKAIIKNYNLPPKKKAHSEIKEIIKRKNDYDETQIRLRLKSEHSSISSANMKLLNLS